MKEQERIQCAIIRGGTSRGVYIKKNELPSDPVLRDNVILAIFGSPDIRQIDGLGGADPLTSKLAVIGPPTRKDADVDYTFGQVSITQSIVDYRGNCGNISAGVGPFAIDEGLVAAKEPYTVVRIHQVNTGRIIIAEVPVTEGKALVEGDYKIDGVPGSGSEIKLDFADFAGCVSGKLLPTGAPRNILEIEGVGKLEVSIVDAANPVVFCRARDMGLKGTERPDEIDSQKGLLERIEGIRATIAQLLGIVKEKSKATIESPYIPFIAFVSPPATYRSYTTGENVQARDIDLTSRLLFMQRTHKAYPVTGAICTAVAARIPGTIVSEVLKKESSRINRLSIGHPAGNILVDVDVEKDKEEFTIARAAIGRTARRIMDGYVYVRRSLFTSKHQTPL